MIYAQLIAYQARVYEYAAYLELFLRDPQAYEPKKLRSNTTKPVILTLVNLDISTRKELVAAEQSQPYIDRAKVLLEEVIAEHPQTPWAARAQWELKRGFGVHLRPDYDPPYRINTSGTPTPIPKL